VIGALCSRSAHSVEGSGSTSSRILDPPRRQPWQVSIGYRYQPSNRHFRGDEEQAGRDEANSEIENIYHLFDVSISRQITQRWTLNASIPILFANRDQRYPPVGEYRVRSVGDMTVGGRVWLFRPPTESGGNVGVGFNLKLPTGDYNATSLAVNRDGSTVQATADQSILAGDGRTGFSIDFQAYKPIPWQSMVYFSGTYLFNPADTNGVSTFRRAPYEDVMSVADQYLLRGGVSRPIPKLRGFVATFGARWEGVPAHDAIGNSNGFRRPGYAVSLDPGLMYARGSSIYSVSVPFAIHRDRTRSVPDLRNNSHGDAAFADYAITLGFSRTF
jgi:hypothetical protein